MNEYTTAGDLVVSVANCGCGLTGGCLICKPKVSIIKQIVTPINWCPYPFKVKL